MYEPGSTWVCSSSIGGSTRRIVHVIVIGSSPVAANTISPPSRRSTVMSASNGSHQSASRAGFVIASQTSRIGIGELAFESDDAAVGGAFQVPSYEAVVRSLIGVPFALGGIGVAVRCRCRSSASSRPAHSARYGSSHASSSISGSGRSRYIRRWASRRTSTSPASRSTLR